MNVKQLKAIIDKLPDETPIVTDHSDHSYRAASAQVTTGLLEGRNQWSEDYGEEITPEKTYGKRMQVVLVS